MCLGQISVNHLGGKLHPIKASMSKQAGGIPGLRLLSVHGGDDSGFIPRSHLAEYEGGLRGLKRFMFG